MLQEECEVVKIDIHCRVQGDVVLECIHFKDDLVREEMIFRIMFHTEFVRSNVLMLTRDEVDVLWDAKDQISREFRGEVRFLYSTCYFSRFLELYKLNFGVSDTLCRFKFSPVYRNHTGYE